MDEEEIRILKLTRIGREKIIKYGTYDIQNARNVYIQGHPFYVSPETIAPKEEEDFLEDELQSLEEDSGVTLTAPPPPELSEAELMSQIMSSNFKTGLSQEEVDALLGTMNV